MTKIISAYQLQARSLDLSTESRLRTPKRPRPKDCCVNCKGHKVIRIKCLKELEDDFTLIDCRRCTIGISRIVRKYPNKAWEESWNKFN